MNQENDAKVLATELQMAQNRLELRALLDPPSRSSNGMRDAAFPRSHTFRWFIAQLSAPRIVSAIATAVLTRLPGLRTVRRYIFSGRG